jgi:hypothetical protein
MCVASNVLSMVAVVTFRFTPESRGVVGRQEAGGGSEKNF